MKIGTVLVVSVASVPAVVATWLVASRTVGVLVAGVPSVVATPDEPALTTDAAVEWFWALNGPISADAGVDLSVDREGNVFLVGSHGGLDMDRDGVVDLDSGATAYVGAMTLSLAMASSVRAGWSGARSDRIDVYRNGELIATVPNDGSHVDEIPRERLSPPYRYRVCEAGSTTCSATWESRR